MPYDEDAMPDTPTELPDGWEEGDWLPPEPGSGGQSTANVTPAVNEGQPANIQTPTGPAPTAQSTAENLTGLLASNDKDSKLGPTKSGPQANQNQATSDSSPQRGSTNWIPADPERTKQFICEGLKNGGYINRDDPNHKNDLSWRDAEHALFAYTTIRDHPALLPSVVYATSLYSGAKAVAGLVGGLDPDTSPGSLEEAQAGIEGAFRGMDAAVGKDNPFQCPPVTK